MTFILQLRGETYQLINIHQRTKTGRCSCPPGRRISLSISIREPKPGWDVVLPMSGISLSISIREPKLHSTALSTLISISLSISIREPKRQARDETERAGISLSISIREPKLSSMWGESADVSAYQYPSENQNLCDGGGRGRQYQLINIHQRTKTGEDGGRRRRQYQLINIHQRTKTPSLRSSIL